MKNLSERVFLERFQAELINFRQRFLKDDTESGRSKKKKNFVPYKECLSDLEVCIIMNGKASSSKGVKYIPLLQFHEVLLIQTNS